jgi:peroxiredoxin
MPSFAALPATDGTSCSSAALLRAKVLVIVFSCNHCPYVQAYEDRMIAFQSAFAPKGVRLVAINANETVNYPEDNFQEMVRRAKKRGFNFTYLRDEDQSVAGAFGATHTPEFFVFAPRRGEKEFRLVYHGRMDDNHQNPDAVREHYLQDAVEAALAGVPASVPETHSIGCTIKWR